MEVCNSAISLNQQKILQLKIYCWGMGKEINQGLGEEQNMLAHIRYHT